MAKTDYLTKPYGDRPADPVEAEAYDFLVDHGGEGGAQAVKDLAGLLRKPRCRADKSTLDMWRAGADFFSSKHGRAERCQMARDCYEAMIRARTK